MRVGLYIRISEDRDDQRAGVTRQLADTRATATRRWPDAEQVVYEDNDQSAWSGKRRPDFARLVTDIGRRYIDAVVGWNLDRMFTRPRELEDFIDLCNQTHMQEVVTSQGDLDLTTHDGQLTARILVAVARKERDNISRRVKRDVEDRQARGCWHGGIPPYGYRTDPDAPGGITIHPSNAAALQWATTRVLKGDPLIRIVREWHAAHPMSRAPATSLSLRWALLNPAVIARTRAATPAQWPSILENDQWAAVSSLLLDPRRSTTSSRVRRYWLAGLLACGRCATERRMASRPNQGDRRYLCLACSNGIDARKTELAVSELLFVSVSAVKRSEVSRQGILSSRDEVARERLAELTALYVKGKLTRIEWQVARDTALVTSRVHEPAVLLPLDLRSEWPSYSVQQRHQLASRALQYVRVGPSVRPRFDPDRLHPHWRQ